jgi:hypothetical protein
LVQILRSHVLEGAFADGFHIGTVHHCGGGILEVTTVLVATQLHDIRADPRPVLVEPPPGNRRIATLGVYYSKAAGAYGGGGALTINHTNSANTLIGTINHGEITTASARSGWASLPALTGTSTNFALPTDGLDINSSSDFTGAGGDLTIVVRYVEVE